MIYYHNMDYEDSLIREIFIFFDDHIEELEEIVVERYRKVDAMFGSGEFDARFIGRLLDDLEVEEATLIIRDAWDEEKDISLWKDERDPDMQLIVKASYTYGKTFMNSCAVFTTKSGMPMKKVLPRKGVMVGHRSYLQKPIIPSRVSTSIRMHEGMKNAKKPRTSVAALPRPAI